MYLLLRTLFSSAYISGLCMSIQEAFTTIKEPILRLLDNYRHSGLTAEMIAEQI